MHTCSPKEMTLGQEYSIWPDVKDPDGLFTITEGCEFSLIGKTVSAADLLRSPYSRAGVAAARAGAYRLR